jgi:hypothetical protein
MGSSRFERSNGYHPTGELDESLDDPMIKFSLTVKRAAQRMLQISEPITDIQQRKLDLEARRREAVRNDIASKFSPHIRKILAVIDKKPGRLAQATITNRKISDHRLTSKLGEYGYISPEIAEAGELDLAGIIAGLLLTDQTIPEVDKYNLTGLNRHISKEVIEAEIENYTTPKVENN